MCRCDDHGWCSESWTLLGSTAKNQITQKRRCRQSRGKANPLIWSKSKLRGFILFRRKQFFAPDLSIIRLVNSHKSTNVFTLYLQACPIKWMILISYKHFLSRSILCRKSKISTLSKPPLNPGKEAITDQSNYQSHRLHFSGKQYHEKNSFKSS